MLVELSVMEQRYEAVLALEQDGWKVADGASSGGRAIRARPPQSIG